MFPPPLFKDIPKFDSPFHRTGLGVAYPGYGPSILHPPGLGTPFVPPNHVTSFAPKVNILCYYFNQVNSNHLKIACEIHSKCNIITFTFTQSFSSHSTIIIIDKLCFYIDEKNGRRPIF